MTESSENPDDLIVTDPHDEALPAVLSDQDDDDDIAVPWLWGTLGLAAVMILAVLLFRDIDLSGSSVSDIDVGSASGAIAAESVVTPVGADAGDADAGDSDNADGEGDTAALVDESALLVDRLRADGRFTRLVGLLEDNDLIGRLSGTGPFTLFAPTDVAFDAATLNGSEALMRRLLFRHLVGGSNDANGLLGLDFITMLDGSDLAISGESIGSLTIDGVTMAEPDMPAGNGIIHVMDGLFEIPLPGLGDLVAADPSNFNTLRLALESTGLDSELASDGLVLLAPTDVAFGGLPSGIVDQLVADPNQLAQLLRHHLLRGPLAGDGEYETLAGDVVVVAGDSFDSARSVGSERPGSQGASLIPIDSVLVPGGFELGNVNDVIGLEPIEFEVGSAEITASGQAELDRAIEYLLANPVRVEIGGHTDSNGDESTNLALSEDRAQAVVDYLTDGGVEAELLSAVGYGESEPVADNGTSAGRAQNRRIEFTILG